ncbi:MAG TPA: hypothetical protein VKT51_06295 [Candidatus Eremiobacteraceae bacterium]|nr:hypothetical protein [Candidatus Eremiobacteraceae bacterium]
MGMIGSFGSLVTATLVAAALHASAPSGTTPTPTALPTQSAGDQNSATNGDLILDRAVQMWRARTYPSYMRYLIDVRAKVRGSLYAEGFQAWVRTADDFVITQQAPLYSTNQQPSMYGTRFSILGWDFAPHEGVGTPYGVPRISPFYSFGFVPRSAVDFHPHPQSTDNANATVIGKVTATARYYTATLVGEEQCDAGPCWHLALTPVEDPGEYRVRGMWVDEASFEPERLTVAGIFNGCSATTANWDVRYMNFHGQWLLREETTTSSLRAGGGIFGFGSSVYDQLTYTLGHYHFFDSLDDYLFFDRGSTAAMQE